MQRLFTIILTAAVLAHAIFGCCLHHAHSCEADCCDTASANVDACPCSGHEEPNDTVGVVSLVQPDGSDQEPFHQGPHRCEGDKCSFARTESSPDAGSLNAGEFLDVLALPAISLERITDAPAAATSFKPDAVSGTPRRHLVLAVLLI